MVASKSDGLLQMVDPNGTGMYKGMFIGGVEIIEEPVSIILYSALL
jgi:hypothetical protein